MAELYTTTLKYFWLAIKEFLPLLEKLRKESQGLETKQQIESLIEAYTDIAEKINNYNLNFTDPNRHYDSEPFEIEIDIPEPFIENLTRLSYRLLEEWKRKKERLEKRQYLTDENKKELYNLRELIWPLEALSKEQSYVLGKHASKGPLVFPGEVNQKSKKSIGKNTTDNYIPLFPKGLLEIIPGALKTLCEEFDHNYKNENSNACILLLRKIIPLAIVRKFQQVKKEDEIKTAGEYLQTKALLGKAQEELMSSKKIYDEIINYKLLIDASQHIFTVTFYIEDIARPAIAVRVMLEDFFNTEDDPCA
jgi:hypothetical protein